MGSRTPQETPDWLEETPDWLSTLSVEDPPAKLPDPQVPAAAPDPSLRGLGRAEVSVVRVAERLVVVPIPADLALSAGFDVVEDVEDAILEAAGVDLGIRGDSEPVHPAADASVSADADESPTHHEPATGSDGIPPSATEAVDTAKSTLASAPASAAEATDWDGRERRSHEPKTTDQTDGSAENGRRRTGKAGLSGRFARSGTLDATPGKRVFRRKHSADVNTSAAIRVPSWAVQPDQAPAAATENAFADSTASIPEVEAPDVPMAMSPIAEAVAAPIADAPTIYAVLAPIADASTIDTVPAPNADAPPALESIAQPSPIAETAPVREAPVAEETLTVMTPTPNSALTFEAPALATSLLDDVTVEPGYEQESEAMPTTGERALPSLLDGAISKPSPVVIRASAITRTFHVGAEEIEALRGVSLEIRAGELVAITGPSGSGKTTLLNCLSGLDEVTSGQVLIGNQDLAELSDAERARHRATAMGFVFQQANLLPAFTAIENVELPLLLNGWNRRLARQHAEAALQRVGLIGRRSFPPAALSGGEQQRVAVARALVGDPQIVWADEPTGNLDIDSAAQVLDLLDELNEGGLTVLIVTHDEQIANAAPRRIVLSQGRITADTVPAPLEDARHGRPAAS